MHITMNEMAEVEAIVKAEQAFQECEAVITLRLGERIRVIVRKGKPTSNRFQVFENGKALYQDVIWAISSVAYAQFTDGWGEAVVTPCRAKERVAARYQTTIKRRQERS